MSDLLEYFEKTIEERERYPEVDSSEIEAVEQSIDRLMYEIDGSRGHVVNTNGEDGIAGNSAAFISQNFGDNPLLVYEFQTEEDENLGFAAMYENPDEGSREVISNNGALTIKRPSRAVFVFNPEEPDQYDIKVE